MVTGTSTTQHLNESATQWRPCRCGKRDGSVWAGKASNSRDKKASTRCPNCQNLQVLKSGPLLISSKGLGWTTWKKRWFILTRTSLVFFRSDPNAPAQRTGEVNLTLGGIELNSSGSVVVTADKKLLTLIFPDGRDGRTFTLKAETAEDMHEWRTALENALSQAVHTSLVLGKQNSIVHNDTSEMLKGSVEPCKDGKAIKSSVTERAVLLALEDSQGNPSFLEKALKFIEQYGIRVEGILRQSADVEEVEHRVEEYEKGKNEFSPYEDAHVIGDCIKHVLRASPTSAVPPSCCTALLGALRGERGARVGSMCTVISETFPEANRRLLQRILKMMHIVASHKSENRMSLPALAACMAPLLLRPLLAGDCELEDEFDMGGDGSIQLLQAAAAANHAHAIVVILLEQYDRIFTDGHLQEDSCSSEVCSESEFDENDEDDQEDEEFTDNEIDKSDGYYYSEDDVSVANTVDDPEHASCAGRDESNSEFSSDLYEKRDSFKKSTSSTCNELPQDSANLPFRKKHYSATQDDAATSTSPAFEPPCRIPSYQDKEIEKLSEQTPIAKHPAIWGRTNAMNYIPMETLNPLEHDEAAIERLEYIKSDLQNQLAKEVKENKLLQASLERKKTTLCDCRLALQREVERLQIQLQKERGLRTSLEAKLVAMQSEMPISSMVDNKNASSIATSACENPQRSYLQKKQDLVGDSGIKPIEATTTSMSTKEQQFADVVTSVLREHSKNKVQDSTNNQQKHVRSTPVFMNSASSAHDKPIDGENAMLKKPSGGDEDLLSASVLARLTNRLNFLKERRLQLVNELRAADEDHAQDSECPPANTNS